VAHSYVVLGALDRAGFEQTRLEQKVMEDSRIYSTIGTTPPFSALTSQELGEIAKHFLQLRAPARLPVCGSSHELGKHVVLIMSGTFDVRCQVLVRRDALGLVHSANGEAPEALGFSDVPIISLSRGSMWNADLVMSTEEERDWCQGVEFSHHRLYPREESKCLVVSLRDLTNFSYSNKTMRRAMDAYAKLFRHQRKTSIYHVLACLCKPDFQAKVSGYMKQIMSTLDSAEVAWQKALIKYEKEVHEDLDLFSTLGGVGVGGQQKATRQDSKFAIAQNMGKQLERV